MLQAFAHQLDEVIECPISARRRWVYQTWGQEPNQGRLRNHYATGVGSLLAQSCVRCDARAVKSMSMVALGGRGGVTAASLRRPPAAPENVPNCGVITAQGVVLDKSCDSSTA